MPLSERLMRLKGRVKDRLRLSTRNNSTASLPDVIQPSPPSTPVPIMEDDTIPISSIPGTSVLPQDSVDIAPHLGSPSRMRAASTVSLPNMVLSQGQTLARTPSVPSPHDAMNLGTSPKADNNAKWTGLKALQGVLERSAGAFGPLRLVTDGFNQCIDSYKVSICISLSSLNLTISTEKNATKGREDYDELRKKLDSLLGDLSQFLGGPMSPTMTMSMKNLCK
jgi:hypothetical protein